MCFICDGGTGADYLRHVAAGIGEHGWSVVGVEPHRTAPGWAYTIGLAERFDHPELVVTGICCVRCAHVTLYGIGDLVATGTRLAAGDEVRAPEGTARARLGPVHRRQWQTSLFSAWLAYYADDPSAPTPAALQVITLDRRGRWQDDPGNRRWRHQRLDRAPHLPGRR